MIKKSYAKKESAFFQPLFYKKFKLLLANSFIFKIIINGHFSAVKKIEGDKMR